MGTSFKDGDKPKNNVTISKSSAPARQVNPDSGKVVDRSFAQPNPALPQREIESKTHASAKDEADALSQNSAEGRTYEQGGDESTQQD